MTLSQLRPNPFKSILSNISSDWATVTIEFLEYVKNTINYDYTRLSSLDEAFKTLRYLEEYKIVEIRQVEDTFQIRKL
jgi:hypothetical protein